MLRPSVFAAEVSDANRVWSWPRVALHGLAWTGVALLPMAADALLQRTPAAGFQYWFMLFPTAALATFYYLNSLVFIPQLLARRQVARYFGASILTLGSLGGLMAFMRLTLLPHVRATQPHSRALAITIAILIQVAVWALSSWGRITSEWFEAERRRRELENGQLAAELALLKSQVSPHFLFNTLNNVYSLAHLKSDDAPEAILKLSLLLRYMLYEADTPRVPLAREIEYIENYVDLQRLRLDEQLRVDFQVEGDCTGLLLEPMLLIPFVENAFKHGISYQHPAPIELSLRVDNQQLLFRVRNRCFPVQSGAAPPAGGMGLPNIARRLDLLYPDRYSLKTGALGDFYLVELALQLHPTATLPGTPPTPSAHPLTPWPDATLPIG